MREGRPSTTASAVATARAVAGIDPIARRLLGGPFGLAARLPARRAYNLATLGLVDHVELRTRAIDRVVREARVAGIDQVVILGAGLDARAWRMPELAGAVVLEIDHPATQRYKRERIDGAPSLAREVRFVGVDFAKDSLDDALARADHDPAAPTLWIWEGVTMYLPREAMRATLGAVAARSAAKSVLAMSYATPEGTTLGPRIIAVGEIGFHILGEPILGAMTPEEAERELDDVGFAMVRDRSARDWARDEEDTSGVRAEKRFLIIHERLAVAARGK